MACLTCRCRIPAETASLIPENGLHRGSIPAAGYRIWERRGVSLELILIGAAAFVGGALVSWANSFLLRRLIASRGESGIAAASPIRTILSGAYLLVLYIIGKRTGLNPVALLIGGALGLTAALAFFTIRLTRAVKKQGKE